MRTTLTALCVASLAILACSGNQQPVTASERQLGWTARDIARSFPSMVVDPSIETWSIEYYSWDTWELEYEYDSARGGPGLSYLYVRQSFSHEPSESDAIESFKVGVAMFKGVLSITGPPIQRDHLATWGDRNQCWIATLSGAETGFFCGMQKGRHTVFVNIDGAVLSDPGDLDALMASQLEALSSWDPATIPRR